MLDLLVIDAGAQGQLLPLAVLDDQVDVDAFATGANATERCSSARCAFCTHPPVIARFSSSRRHGSKLYRRRQPLVRTEDVTPPVVGADSSIADSMNTVIAYPV